MRFGAQITQAVGLNPAGRDYVTLAQHAEGLGFAAVWMGDHIAIPRQSAAKYPYSQDGSIGFPRETPFYDTLAVLTAIAACTSRIDIGTGVIVLPYRHPLDLAKRVATADQMSNGRLLLGVGVGWLQEEFEALAIPFRKRGAIADETIRAMKALWAGNGFEGEHFSVPPMHMAPRPVQTPHPPFIVGGGGDAAFRRIVAHGDGWIAGPLPSERMKAELAQLEAMIVAAGRAMSELRIVMGLSPVDVMHGRDELAALDQAGVHEISVQFRGASGVDDARRRMDELARLLEL